MKDGFYMRKVLYSADLINPIVCANKVKNMEQVSIY